MTKAKIGLAVIVGIILLSVAVIGGFFWNQQRVILEKRENAIGSQDTTTSKYQYNTKVDTEGLKNQFKKDREYYYYYNEEKQSLKFLGFEDGRPVFGLAKNPDCRMYYENLFCAQLKQGFTEKDLDELNKKYDVSVIAGQESGGMLRLKVNNEKETNAYDMGNAYNGEDMIEWSDSQCGFLQVGCTKPINSSNF